MQSRYQIKINFVSGGVDVIDTTTGKAVCNKATAGLAWDAARSMNIQYHEALQRFPLKAGGSQREVQRFPLRAAIESHSFTLNKKSWRKTNCN